MFSKISTLALIAASAVALPTDTAPWVWSVKNYTSVCSAATCRYGFNVSAPAGPSGQPSFDATGCIGTSVQGDYKSCIAVGIASPGDVLSEQFNGGINVGANVSVRVVFEQNSVRYTYTGNTTVGHANYPVNFDVTPTEVFAVA